MWKLNHQLLGIPWKMSKQDNTVLVNQLAKHWLEWKSGCGAQFSIPFHLKQKMWSFCLRKPRCIMEVPKHCYQPEQRTHGDTVSDILTQWCHAAEISECEESGLALRFLDAKFTQNEFFKKWVFKKGRGGAGCFHIIYVKSYTVRVEYPITRQSDLSIDILY